MDEGPDALARYVEQVKAKAGRFSDRIKGFRYITQDHAPGVSNPMRQESFIESLRWLAVNGYSHDFVVDSTRFGIAALADISECLAQVYAGLDPEVRSRFVIGRAIRAPGAEPY